MQNNLIVRNILNKLSLVFLVIGGFEWCFMLVVTILDPSNSGDLDDALIYSDSFFILWFLRILHLLITISAFNILFNMISEYRKNLTKFDGA